MELARRQSQTGGDNSVQIQASGSVFIAGIDETRAREISAEIARQVVADYAVEASETIQQRIAALDDRVIASLIRAGRLGAFADPAFLRSYKNAQAGAASSERETDYDLLAGLLSDRADRGENRLVRAGIERAIEVIDQVDDDALRALTVLEAAVQFTPNANGLHEGLDRLEDLFADLLDGDLPEGIEWAEHLDILDAVRISRTSSFKRHGQFLSDALDGYVSAGLPELAPYDPVVRAEGKVIQVQSMLVPHELKPGFVRVGTPRKVRLRQQVADNLRSHSDEVVNAVISWAENVFGVGEADPNLRQRLLDEYRARPHLRIVSEWWDSIPNLVQATSMGRVLARANAHRLDKRGTLPPID